MPILADLGYHKKDWDTSAGSICPNLCGKGESRWVPHCTPSVAGVALSARESASPGPWVDMVLENLEIRFFIIQFHFIHIEIHIKINLQLFSSLYEAVQLPWFFVSGTCTASQILLCIFEKMARTDMGLKFDNLCCCIFVYWGYLLPLSVSSILFTMWREVLLIIVEVCFVGIGLNSPTSAATLFLSFF